MNILIATEVFFPDDPGGAARVPWEVARGLVPRGHRVHLLARKVHPETSRCEERDGVRVLRYPWSPRNPVLSLWRAARMVRAHRCAPDVLHIHQPLEGLAVHRSGCRVRVPEIYFFHSPWAQEFRLRQEGARALGLIQRLGVWTRGRLEDRALRRADRIVTLSEYMTGQLRAHHAVPEDRLARIRGAVDIERFHPGRPVADARRELGWPLDQPILLTVRRLEPRMGIENLLLALAELAASEPDLHLYIVGQGSLRAPLEKQVADLQLGQRVSFTGPVADEVLPLCYQAADAFVLPTQQLEGFGLVTVEALVSGCPVVGTPVGATPEILEPLDPALLAAGPAPHEIAAALRGLLARRGSWPHLRRQCWQYARGRYTWDGVISSVERLSAALCGADHPSSGT